MSWSRAVPGHTQQAHTREFYMLCQPRDLLYTSCMAVWEDGSHFSAYVRTKKKKVIPSETQIPATHLPNQTHSPSSSPWEAKPPTSFPSFCTPTPTPLSILHHATSLPSLPQSPRRGADVMRARGGWKGKSRHAKAPWGHWTDTAVLETRDISLALRQRPQPAWATNESQWHDFMFQRSCQKSQCMCVKDSVEMGGGLFWESQAAGNDNQKYVIDCNK